MRILSCVCFKDNRDNGDNFFSYRNFCFNDNRDAFFLAFVLKTIETIFFSYRNFCFNDNRDIFFMCYVKTKPADKKLSLLSLLSLKTTLAHSFLR